MFPAPAMPTFAPGHATTSTARLRYEDVTQDGRLHPIAIPPSLVGLWNEVLVPHRGLRNAIAQGIVPILSRLTLHSREQPIRVDRMVDMPAGYELAHDRDANGEVTRLYMNVWSELHGTAGRLSRKDSGTAVEPVLAGTLFAEHTFTRLMAPPDQRRVTRFAVEGYPELPEARYAAPAPTTAQDAPDGARWLDELAADSAEYAFTLDQTDSNQHVNSLTYVRLFLDAANRRLAAAERGGRVRSRAVDIAYRKPAFAGDRVRAHLRLFELGDAVGAAGHVAAPDGKPHCYVRALFGG